MKYYDLLKNKQSVTISNQALNLNLNEILQDIKNLEIYTKLPENSGYNQLKDKVNNCIYTTQHTVKTSFKYSIDEIVRLFPYRVFCCFFYSPYL